MPKIEPTGDSTPIVIENGSGVMKIGYGGETAPREVFPSVVGRSKVTSGAADAHEMVFVGDEALAKRIEHELTLHYPINWGVITDWDNLEQIWSHTFFNKLKVAPEERPIMLSEPPLNPKAFRERMTQMMFETFHVAAMSAKDHCVLSLCVTEKSTGAVVSVGDGIAHTVAICDGYTIPHAIRRIDLGGKYLTEYLMQLLNERGYSFITDADKDIVNDIKEKLCYVAQDYDNEMNVASESNSLEKSYKMPDGKLITIGNEAFRCPEVLFKPSLVGKGTQGIQDSLLTSILECDEDVRADLFKNILISGGSTLFRGLGERLKKELVALSPSASDMNIIAPLERTTDAWRGGSILANLSTFQGMWLHRIEYEQDGPKAIHRR